MNTDKFGQLLIISASAGDEFRRLDQLLDDTSGEIVKMLVAEFAQLSCRRIGANIEVNMATNGGVVHLGTFHPIDNSFVLAKVDSINNLNIASHRQSITTLENRLAGLSTLPMRVRELFSGKRRRTRACIVGELAVAKFKLESVNYDRLAFIDKTAGTLQQQLVEFFKLFDVVVSKS